MILTRRSLLTVALAAVGLGVAGCQSPPPPAFPEITFAHETPLALDVAEIDYVEAYLAPQTAPNVDHLFPVRPAAVAKRWAKDRLRAVGTSRRARVTLTDASVTETMLKTRKGITGAFYNEQERRYDATLEVKIEIFDDRGFSQAHASTVAKVSRTVPEDITLNDRDKVWFEMTETLAKKFDAEFERTIRTYLGGFLR